MRSVVSRLGDLYGVVDRFFNKERERLNTDERAELERFLWELDRLMALRGGEKPGTRDGDRWLKGKK